MRLLRRIAAAAAVSALVMATPGIGIAAPNPPEASAPEAVAGAQTPTAPGSGGAGASAQGQPIMLIIDGSGSMKAADVDNKGTTRMDAAKQAANEVIDGLSPSAQVGLTTYGTNTGGSDAEKAKGCADVSVLASVGPLDAAGLKKQIGSIRPSGYTPIGEALKQAAAELPQGAAGGIVLLSDGEDTCAPPPPCDVAEDLAGSGIDLKVHTVGLRVDEKARGQLQCVAEATKGTYADADDTTSLQASMQAATRAALTGYEAQGTPITGGKDRQSAVAIKPGQYLDSLASGSDQVTQSAAERSYSFTLREGERALVSATMVKPWTEAGRDDHDAVRLEVSEGDKDYCGVTDSQLSSSRTIGDLPVTAVADTGVIGPDNAQSRGAKKSGSAGSQSSCFTAAGDYVITVKRSGGSNATKNTPFPLELGLVIQPKLTAGDFPEPATSPQQLDFLPPAQEAKAMSGGTSFGTAPELTEPAVKAEMNVGEVHYFKVPVAYGQQLRARAEMTVPGLGEHESANAHMWVLNPLREEMPAVRPGDSGAKSFDAAKGISGDHGHVLSVGPGPRALALNTAVPINPRNLDTEENPKFNTRPASFDGYSYIAVGFADVAGKRIGEPGEYTLKWDVVGDPIAGPRAAGAGGDDSAQSDDADSSGGSSALSSALKWGGIGLGVALLVGAALAVILWLRTRRSRTGG